MDAEISGELDLGEPILLVKMREIKAPLLEVFADAQGADDVRDFFLECHDARIVEVIPVIVRHQEHVDRGEVLCCVDVATAKRLVDEEKRRRVIAQYGVDEDAFSRDPQEEGRVPEPDDRVFVRCEALEIRLFREHGLLGFESLLVAEEELPRRRQAALAVHALLHDVRKRLEALELSVVIIRRGKDALAPRALGQPPKLRAMDEPARTARRETGGGKRTEDKVTSFYDGHRFLFA